MKQYVWNMMLLIELCNSEYVNYMQYRFSITLAQAGKIFYDLQFFEKHVFFQGKYCSLNMLYCDLYHMFFHQHAVAPTCCFMFRIICFFYQHAVASTCCFVLCRTCVLLYYAFCFNMWFVFHKHLVSMLQTYQANTWFRYSKQVT